MLVAILSFLLDACLQWKIILGRSVGQLSETLFSLQLLLLNSGWSVLIGASFGVQRTLYL